jgi:hypothetical protein
MTLMRLWVLIRAMSDTSAAITEYGQPGSICAALYTLDVLIPIPAPTLGQASDWDPHGNGLAVAAGLHVLGWLLAITVIAAITRSFSRS